VFGLSWALLECDEHTTLDDFGVGVLVKEERYDYFSKDNGGFSDNVWRLFLTRRLHLMKRAVLYNVGLTADQSDHAKVS
jgi:hypothetical protein